MPLLKRRQRATAPNGSGEVHCRYCGLAVEVTADGTCELGHRLMSREEAAEHRDAALVAEAAAHTLGPQAAQTGDPQAAQTGDPQAAHTLGPQAAHTGDPEPTTDAPEPHHGAEALPRPTFPEDEWAAYDRAVSAELGEPERGSGPAPSEPAGPDLAGEEAPAPRPAPSRTSLALDELLDFGETPDSSLDV